jgi:exonuclease VII small subunit
VSGDTVADGKRMHELRSRRDEIVRELETGERRLKRANEIFADPDYYGRTPKDQVVALQEKVGRLQSRVEALTGEWEAIETEIDQLK